MSADRSPVRDRRKSYSLAILFFWITIATTAGSMLGVVVRTAASVTWQALLLLSILTAIASMILGGIMGIFHVRRTMGVVSGMLSGAIIGAVIGPALAIDPRGVYVVLAAEVTGAVLLVITATALRLVNASSDDPFVD